MTVRASDPGYAPLPLVVDPATFALTTTTTSSPFGTIVARSARTSRSLRATVFLHGAAGSWTTWSPILSVADAESITIPNPVLLDLPGWGDGVLTAAGEDDPLEAISSLVRASVEALGYTEWDLVGHSMGGFVAMHMAALWPECVTSVSTISATAWSVVDVSEHPLRHFWRLPGFVLLWRVMQVLAGLGRAGTAISRGLAAAHLLRLAVVPLFRHPRRIPRSVITALAVEARPRSFSAAVELLRGYNPTITWATIDCPVRAVQGDHDVFSRAVDLERLGDILPASYRELIADCGHFAGVERPHEVLAAFGFTADQAQPRVS
jgi:pimeloyl-ACP methyl ester carboxylesterase